jgi:hypothetical protein
VLDFETTEGVLRDCLAFLDVPHQGLVDMGVGRFGQVPVRLNVHHDDSLSIIVDGPSFEPQRELCAAIWLSRLAHRHHRGVVRCRTAPHEQSSDVAIDS